MDLQESRLPQRLSYQLPLRLQYQPYRQEPFTIYTKLQQHIDIMEEFHKSFVPRTVDDCIEFGWQYSKAIISKILYDAWKEAGVTDIRDHAKDPKNLTWVYLDLTDRNEELMQDIFAKLSLFAGRYIDIPIHLQYQTIQTLEWSRIIGSESTPNEGWAKSLAENVKTLAFQWIRELEESHIKFRLSTRVWRTPHILQKIQSSWRHDGPQGLRNRLDYTAEFDPI